MSKIEKRQEQLCRQQERRYEKLIELYETITADKNAELADTILKRAVTDGREIEFELIGGLKLREKLY